MSIAGNRLQRLKKTAILFTAYYWFLKEPKMKKMLLSMLMLAAPVVFCGADDVINVYYENGSNGSFLIFADNAAYCPVYINITFPVLTNLSANINLPFELVIPARTSRFRVLTLNPVNRNNATRFNYSYTYYFGDPFSAAADRSFLYLFPYAEGESFEVIQGFNGTFSHYNEHQYSIDFKMPVGTAIHAARAGIVVEIKKDSNTGGNNRSFWNDANYILVYHSDGTFGSYLHLRHNGVVVTPGQTIAGGQLIGYSGNTGFSDTPHLHFMVSAPQRNSDRVSVPFQFLTSGGRGVVPQKGEYYRAVYR